MLPFRSVVLELTEACPHACVHCYNYWREQRARPVTPTTLSRTEIRDLVRRIKQETRLEQVALSGGEPMLRPDLPGIVRDLTDEDLSVVVITSGALLTPTRLRRLPAGTALEMSIFSADEALHDRIAGRKGALRRVIEGATRASRHGCRLAVSVVVNALNAHDVRRALELGIALGAEGFLLNRVNVTRLTLPQAPWLVPNRSQIEEMLAAAESVAAEFDAPIAVSVPIPPCIVDLSPYSHLHFGWCPRGGDNAYYTVSHDGKLRPCNHSSVVLGDIRRESFASLVNGAPARDFWSPLPAGCAACEHPLRDQCRGGCPAASDECYGTRERWDPIVDLTGILTPPSAAAAPRGNRDQGCSPAGTPPG